ncbi:FtsW/RodA/SpoVE family cell cycle protein [Veillonella sp. T11011-6]|uniref:FtsW/RodA/SpoVE family cell cycle protein n=1 Tax=Veillonella sp. T11011-6 TaxID=2027459 RepID=UPI000CF57E8F|nr:putative peptidoglycan glycosyltransferase FtsW [Veillonella sp. T11011-6]PQL09543.1 stage V sporulation protein E [Veillonella sp. T11011-6]
METPNKGDSRWGSLFKNDLQGMLLPILLITIIGSVNIFSATYISSIYENTGLLGYFTKHMGYLLFSMAVGVVLYRYDYRKLQKPHMLQRIMIATLIGMVLVLLIGSVINGARRWIVIGLVSIQPSEFAKLAAIIWTSAKLSTMRKWGKPRYNNPLTNLQGYVGERVGYMLPMLVWPIIFAILTILQPDMGTTVLIFGFSFILIYLAGFDGRFFGGAFAVAGVIGFIAARMSPYRWERIQSWFDPWPHAQDMGYQTVQGLLAVGSGGILGEGFMQGTSKYFYLPEAHTDFAFAVWAQEMGFVGAVFVVLLVAAFTYFGFRIANKSRDEFGRWLAMGITLLISGQALFNIAMVCGIMPVTGVPLPFISYGGSSLLMNFMAIGLLASVGRRNVEGVKQVGTTEDLPSLREETQSRFKPKATPEADKTEMPGPFRPRESRRPTRRRPRPKN